MKEPTFNEDEKEEHWFDKTLKKARNKKGKLSTNQYKILLNTKKSKEAVYNVSQDLIERYSIKTLKGSKREIYIYQDGMYVLGEEIIKKDIRDLLQELCSASSVKEVIETIKDLSPIDREEFTTEKHLLNLENGVLDVRTKELMGHSPEHLFLTKIPVIFNPEAECPAIKKYLSDVLDDDQITIVKEWAGYALYPEYFIKKAIIFVGDGDTGKTTLINLLHTFYGEKNVSGVSLQKISIDKFSCAHLYKRYINLYDDLSFKDISDNGAFKIATGGGIITGEKKFGDQFQFKNYAKLTFACNKIPDVKDADDEAYFNRWIVIQFNYVVDEKDKDKQLIHKMTTTEELSGFLNLALEGLGTLLKNERFSYNKSADEIKAEMLQSGSSIGKFAFSSLESAENNWITKDDMYRAFIQYTQQNNIPNTGIETLGKRLPKYASYISTYRPSDKNKDKQVRAWSNVKFKDGTNFVLPRKEDILEEFGISDNDIIDNIDDSNSYEN